MKQGSKPVSQPKLRFPEFRDAPGWEETLLKDVLTEHELKSDGASEVHSVSVHKGVINQKEHLGRSFAAADTSNYNLAQPHDIIYTKSPTGDFAFGVVKQNKLGHNVIVSPLYGVFEPINRYLGYILDAYFESPIWTSNYLAPITQKGAKNTIQITNETFISKGLYIPLHEGEQQKIAESLSSVDELIAAHDRKLDALKIHKKGLLQQLFPRIGETKPRLRFPEFQDAGEWVEKDVGALIYTVTPPKKIQTSGYLSEGQFPIVDQSQSFICGWTNDVDAVITGEPPILVFGDHTCALKLLRRPFAQGADGIKILKSKPPISIEFLYQALQVRPLTSDEYRRHFALLQEKKISFPGKETGEQQKIISFLSYLDDLIVAQAQKLDVLKTHKRGLMQQFFPSPTED